VPPAQQLDVEPLLQHGQPQLVQPGRLAGQQLAAQAAQRRAAPLVEGAAEKPCGVVVPAGASGLPGRGRVPHERIVIDGMAAAAQRVAGWPGGDGVG
jgi:hypothetical protein